MAGAGYIKDAWAVVAFAVAMVLCARITDLNVYRVHIMSLLAIAFVVDGIFTLYPSLHCSPLPVDVNVMCIFGVVVLCLLIAIAPQNTTV